MDVPKEIMLKYMERRRQDLKECLSSLKYHSYGEIEKVGHQLKGNGATFGHPELSYIGKEMEIAARRHDSENVEKALNDFSKWLNTLH